MQKAIAAETDIATSSLSAWADTDNHALPNVEQAYYIAQALDQNLMDMIGGQVQPRTSRLSADEQRLLAIFSRLPAAQRRTLLDTAEAFAVAASAAHADSSKQEQAG